MTDKMRYMFRGDRRRRAESPHPESPKYPEPYIASDELIKAVNLAIYLNRPLLLEGEAGCGKTKLARAVAYELGLPFYTWYVRSTSKAQEGLYSYDAILRLHDVQTRQVEAQAGRGDSADKAAGQRDPRDATDYRKLGPLGQAFSLRECPAVVLIDEIDKADIDFPNDMLSVLDDPWEFEIPETGEVIKASEEFKPIIIITSNKEKGNLPAPFLRRCIYYFLEFPQNEDWLKEIVNAHYGSQDDEPLSADLLGPAVTRFLTIRRDWGLYKRPGTSELLDWLEALRSSEKFTDNPSPFSEESPLPYPELLIKLRADWQRYILAR